MDALEKALEEIVQLNAEIRELRAKVQQLSEDLKEVKTWRDYYQNRC